jgi:hypothetical protein
MPSMPSFVKIGSGIQKFTGGTQRQHDDLISLRLFFQNKERMLKSGTYICSKTTTGFDNFWSS